MLTIRIRDASLPVTRKLKRLSILLFILQTRMPHWERKQAYIPQETDFKNYRKSLLRRCNTKLTPDQGKNLTSQHQKRSPSNLFRNIALADWLCQTDVIVQIAQETGMEKSIATTVVEAFMENVRKSRASGMKCSCENSGVMWYTYITGISSSNKRVKRKPIILQRTRPSWFRLTLFLPSDRQRHSWI